MKILATKPESLVEWPAHLSFVIFIAGCNFKCPFCYVPHLVKPELYSKINGISEQEILSQLEKRKDFIDAVCISGGEATIHSELPYFLKKIKAQAPNVKIRLETNGSNPEMLKELIGNKLIDSIALDIKNSREKYSQTTNTEANIESIEKTFDIIKNFDYEARMTLVPDLHILEDIKQAAGWLKDKGINKLVLQQFRSNLPSQQTLNPQFMTLPNFPLEEMHKITQEIRNIINIEIRGEG
jgi:pyruvate formate lyase activating enzyme